MKVYVCELSDQERSVTVAIFDNYDDAKKWFLNNEEHYLESPSITEFEINQEYPEELPPQEWGLRK